MKAVRAVANVLSLALLIVFWHPACGLGLEGVQPSQTTLVNISARVVLPWATLGTDYSYAFEASGGVEPYTWTISEGALPPGLVLSSSGLLSGKPQEVGHYTFTVTLRDSTGATASKTFSLLVILPPTPTITLTGLKSTANPAEQIDFDVELSWPYPREITGSITLSFTPNAVNESDDPAIQFMNGDRTLRFTIPAGRTTPVWEIAPSLQTGTVAGNIKLKVKYSSDGTDLTPLFPLVYTISIAQAAPVITAVEVVRTSGGLEVITTGYSTPREVKSATFEFTIKQATGTNTISVKVSVESAFSTWYSSEDSAAYGSSFTYAQPFTIKGDLSSIESVSITLTNSTGSSEATSVEF